MRTENSSWLHREHSKTSLVWFGKAWLTQSNTNIFSSAGHGRKSWLKNWTKTEILPFNSFLVYWVDVEHWEHLNCSTCAILFCQVQADNPDCTRSANRALPPYLTPQLQPLQSCWARSPAASYTHRHAKTRDCSLYFAGMKCTLKNY